MSNNIAIYNFKGGVGKTTTTINLGYNWSKFFKVLLIDLDPQCNLTNVLAKDTLTSTINEHIKYLLHDQTPKIQPLAITPYLHLIPGDYKMVYTESNNQYITFGAEIMARFFKYVSKDYDLILLDCPTNFGVLVKSIFQNINSILIPTLPDTFSVTGVQTLMQYLATLDSPKPINILGIFFNMYRNDIIQNREILENAKHLFGKIILNTTIGTTVKVREAATQGLALSDYQPDNPVAKEFDKLCDELITKLNEIKTLDNIVISK